MSATDLIAEARAAGVFLSRIGEDRLTWACADDPPPDLLARIRAVKTDVLAALKAEDWSGPRSPLERDPSRGAAPAEPPVERDPTADRLAALERMAERFYVRAGYAKALHWEPSDAEADAIALNDLVGEWRHRSPPTPAGHIDRCARCATATRCNPHGAKGGSLWLCAPCWPAFDAERDAQARAAIIKAMRQAQRSGLLDDVDVDALEAAPPRATMSIGDTFDQDRAASTTEGAR
ncbi:MAG: hypothetical protein ACOYM8_18645 [Caulobacterales bacterium]